MTKDIFEKEKIKLTPETGFDLVGIDYFTESENQLYLDTFQNVQWDIIDFLIL